MSVERMSRREMIARSAAGLGAFGAIGLSPRVALSGGVTAADHPLAPRPPHFEPGAKRVILFFLTGGASHVDSFDFKPELQRRHGESMHGLNLLRSPWKGKAVGESGALVTDLFPHIRDRMGDICLIRSMHGDHNCHYQATLGMHTGSVTFPRPSLGAWVSYALGTQNANLPSHVVFAADHPYAGALVWDANFLPGYHQGVRVEPGETPIRDLTPPTTSGDPARPSAGAQDLELSLLETFNRMHGEDRAGDDALSARSLSFRTAHGMQRAAPEVFDLSGESDATLGLYGVERGDNRSFGWQCLMARRMAERGVRFIELIDAGSSNNWDAHGDILTHGPLAEKIDRPIAGLLDDLKLRGMLDDTLVVFCTEFGRTPLGEGAASTGRSHHSRAFSCWLAGGGVKPGFVHGATDELGSDIAENPVHTHDFHATILHQLGLDHERVTFHHNGRDYRLTDVAGRVVHDLLL